MQLLVLTTQRRSDLSGINTYISEFTRTGQANGHCIEVLSIRETSRRAVWTAIGRADWVHLNTADIISFAFAKLRWKKVVMRFHYTFWGSVHTERFVEWGFSRRLRFEIGLRWRQCRSFNPRKMVELFSHMAHLMARIIVGFCADRVVGCSQFLSQSLELPRSVYTIYYPFRQKVVGLNDDSIVPFLFFCGRVDIAKGVLETIDALHILRERGQEVRLKVAGDGPMLEYAKRKACSLKVDGCIEWLGRVDSGTVTHFMAGALAVLAPSISNDPSPFVVLEAGGASKPVVGSNKGGIPEEISDGGWIVDPSNPEQFADTLWLVWSSPDECKRRGEKLREHVQTRFDAERSVEALFRLLESPASAECYGAIVHHGHW